MDNQQVTPEQYHLRVLKSRFAERVAEYEDQIATLITQIAQLRQENESLKEENGEPIEDDE